MGRQFPATIPGQRGHEPVRQPPHVLGERLHDRARRKAGQPGGGVRRRASALGIAPLAHWAGQQIGLAVPTKRAQDCLEALVHGATRQGWSEGSDDAMTS